MNEFKTYHPLVNFVFFTFVILFSMFFLHPISLTVSFIGAFIYSVMLGGKKAIRFNLLYMLPVALAAAVLNPLFNHEGATVLMYFKNGNPLTAESVYFGLAAASMLCTVMCWFSCYNTVMTSDKFIYLFGRIIPSLSLVLSIVLSFIPRFKARLGEVISAQKGLGKQGGGAIRRFKNASAALSAMTTWSLESAIETSDSMISRGYGLKGRTSFAVYVFSARDIKALCAISFLGIYIIIGACMGGMKYRYFPSLSGTEMNFYTVSVFAAYFLLCIMPIIIEITEVCRWKSIESKI